MRLELIPKRQSTRQSDDEDFEPSRSDIESAERASGQFVSQWKHMISSSRRGTRHFDEKIRVPEEEKAGVSFEDVSTSIGVVARHASYFLSRFGGIPCLGFSSGDRPLCSVQSFFGSKKVEESFPKRRNKGDSSKIADAEQSFLKQ